MNRTVRKLVASIAAVAALCIVSEARAEKDKFDVGEPAQVFALRAVNSDVIGDTLVAVDRYFGPEAKQPKKAILLSFFATYCEPCKKEMPFLAALYDTYKDKGLQVLSISIDREPEQIEFIKTLATQNNVKFPVLSDRFNIVAKRYFISKLPLVYIINGEGKVALVRLGYNDDITRVLVEETRKLVGDTGGPVPDALARFMHGAASAPVADASAAANTATSPAVATDAAPGSTTAPGGDAPAGQDAADGKNGKKGKKKGAAKGKKKGKN